MKSIVNAPLQRFLNLVEIKTKITSVYAFAMALLYAIYLGGDINILLFGCFFIAMLLFDMCTTAINNLIGYRQSVHTLPFSYKTALRITLLLFVLAVLFGSVLAVFSGTIVLILGIICFFFGIIYTCGPVPISALPFGEVVSGLFYGFIIPFICLYMAMPQDYYIIVSLSGTRLTIALEIVHLISLSLVAMPAIACTANIMLANNICDLDIDQSVGRHTLPYYLGQKMSLLLFKSSYVLVFIIYALLTMTSTLNWLTFFVLLLVALPVAKNTKKFAKKPAKETTFIYSIVNYLLVMTAVCAGLLLSILL